MLPKRWELPQVEIVSKAKAKLPHPLVSMNGSPLNPDESVPGRGARRD